MATKKKTIIKKTHSQSESHGDPKFPYSTEPNSLRKLLQQIPQRPKPSKFSKETLKSWNVSSNNNAVTNFRVLKKIGFLTESNEPTDLYIEFMKTGTGPMVLAQKIRDTYKPLYDNSPTPHSESNEELKKLFNIHSGGSEDTLRLQLQTFKALSEFAEFNELKSIGNNPDLDKEKKTEQGDHKSQSTIPPIRLDLHIHLPENKTSREYENIIQDIAKYIYGRNIE